MAYTKKNELLRIIDIRKIYYENSKHHVLNGADDQTIYRDLIFPAYRISFRTFWKYINYKNPVKELEEIMQAEKSQLSLFEK